MVKQNRRALIVDAEAWWRDLVQSVMLGRGLEVEQCDRLDWGLTEAGESEYDIVLISDGVLDNPALEARLRALLKAKPERPVVLVSAIPDWQKTREAFLLGATDHITKTVDANEILSALDRHL